jgi:WhiB family redox-sensing transcriptional regulator
MVRGVAQEASHIVGDSPRARVLSSLSGPWDRDALCREHPEVNFYPSTGQSSEPAKAVCRECLVKRECLVTAMSNQGAYAHGVWGGTAREERRELLRSHQSPGVSNPRSPRVHCPGCGTILPPDRVGLCGDCSGEVTGLMWVSSPRATNDRRS